jgi:hypothetical protein
MTSRVLAVFAGLRSSRWTAGRHCSRLVTARLPAPCCSPMTLPSLDAHPRVLVTVAGGDLVGYALETGSRCRPLPTGAILSAAKPATAALPEKR